MSLVSEALRKVREERNARGRRGALPFAPGHGGGSHFGLGLALGALIALAAALGGAGVVWWLLSRGGAPIRQETSASSTQSIGSNVAAESPLARAGATSTGAQAHAASDDVSTRASWTPMAPVVATPAAVGGSERAPAEQGFQHVAVGALPTAAGGTEPSRRSHGVTREFVLDADLGYARLHLDYLVHKPSAPFGRVNGQDVIIGSTVNGFVVEEIGPDFVKLRDSHGPLVLRVR